ncbi:hypothetical protein M413DRAFT_445882 [Hebeloma cylindrosporum]|uniref:Uncharacterized protein n=1 Tax=Hebeloma cylindrosporum TaxID=76867 RepID=A0A0C3CC58_HEBCY|nr:hypothetical protein M413DRAFT_445882 [Hebeloma cylindrosporum h7]
MPALRGGVAGHTIVGRSFTDNTVYGRAPQFRHSGGSSFDRFGGGGGGGGGGGRQKGNNQPGGNASPNDRLPSPNPSPSSPPPINIPPSTPPPSNPTPSNTSPSNPSPSNPPARGDNGPSEPVPPINIPTSSSSASPTTSSAQTPSTVTNGGVITTTSDGTFAPTNTQYGLSQTPGGYSTLPAGDPTQMPTAGDPNDPISAAAQGGISPAAVAGIAIIIGALLLVLLLSIIRRQARRRRVERTQSLWFYKNSTFPPYADNRSSAERLRGPPSARNSVASSLDQNSIQGVAPLPPMAEVGRFNEGSHYHFEALDRRSSVGSHLSENSQYLFVDLSLEGTDPTTAGHSQSRPFAFPKPPSPIADRASLYSLCASSHVLPITMKGRNSSGVLYPSLVSAQPSPAVPSPWSGEAFASNPFSDNNPFEGPHHPIAPTILITALSAEETAHKPLPSTPQGEVTVSTVDCLGQPAPDSSVAKHVSSHGD